MLKFRLIARLDIRNEHLIKTVKLEGVRKLGDPAEYAKRYNDQGIDEILYLDVVASLYGRNSLHGLIEKTTRDVFCPVTAGGGVRSTDDVRALLMAGADKVCVNTAAVKRPELITEIANKFGSQCCVLQIDAKRKGQGWEAWCEGGREPSGKDAIAWAQEAQERGAGEILLTSIDNEGTGRGLDGALLHACATRSITVPVVASGGIGKPSDVMAAKVAGMAGVSMAHALHLGQGLRAIRDYCSASGVNVRPIAA